MLDHSCGRPNSSNCRLVISALLGVLISACPETAWAQKRALVVTAAPSGPDVETTSTEFVDIPGLTATIATAADGNLAITVTGEVETSSDRRMFVRALVDDAPVTPDDVVFAVGEFTGARSFTFVKEDLARGVHTVRAQWLVDEGGTAFIGDRTLTLQSSPQATAQGGLVVQSAQSGPDVETTSSKFVDIPGLGSRITTAADGNLAITVSGEFETSSNKRLLVRALVDGRPASPSDVLFAWGGFTGTRSFTFILSRLTAGEHRVRIQWRIDDSGTALVGDRTLTLYASPAAGKEGGLYVKATRSGPNEETRSTRFVDIPGLDSSIITAADSDLAITISGEAKMSSGARMFVRALVDDKPISPNNVVLVTGGLKGPSSFMFTKRNLASGSHRVRAQWRVDAGGTASIGDRTLTVSHLRGQIPDLNEPFFTLEPVLAPRKVLAILWDPHRPDDPRPTRVQVADVLYGFRPSVESSVEEYFLENSGGRFTIESEGVLGWFDAQKPWPHYWGPPDQEDLAEDRNGNGRLDPGEDLNSNGRLDGPDGILQEDEDTNQNGRLDYDLDGDGFINGHVEKWAEAIGLADASGFDFAAQDANRNGVLEPDELAILIVIPQDAPFGTFRDPLGQEFPTPQPLVVDGVRIPVIVEAYIGQPPHLGLVAHELSHILLNTPDMYFWFFYPYASGAYSLMDQHGRHPHLDPFHKLRLGWIAPTVVTRSGKFTSRDVETHHEALVLYDPARSDREYYIVENRWPGTERALPSYDRDLPDRGLAVWHIIEDPAVFGELSAPPKVDPNEWNRVGAHDWGRRAVRMIRPVYGPPFDDTRALWDSSDYDLESVDSNPDHATLTWIDGSPSGFAIRDIPPAGPEMSVTIEFDRP